MKLWIEFHAAYLVAQHGTVSAAAEALGVHRATVSRHIDTLEGHLGLRLFHRHARGYTLTEGGEELLRLSVTIEERYNALLGRLQNRRFEVSGELTISSPGPFAPLIIDATKKFQADYPSCRVLYRASERLPNLEEAEVNIALWAGQKPEAPDYIVIPLVEFESGLFANKGYIETYGRPANDLELADHRLVVISECTASSPSEWLRRALGSDTFSDDNVIFCTDDRVAAFRAVKEGLGIGLLPLSMGSQEDDLVPILPDLPVPKVTCWSVTHMDTHRTAKIQAFLSCLKSFGKMDGDAAFRREQKMVLL
ncbi:MAG: LysR family transcriptional regulator [Pseudomonadota bacterium]